MLLAIVNNQKWLDVYYESHVTGCMLQFTFHCIYVQITCITLHDITYNKMLQNMSKSHMAMLPRYYCSP